MPETAGNPLSRVLEREITRVVTLTADPSQLELYRNRRAAARHHRCRPILVCRLDGDPGADTSAALHDISTDGIGFFCETGFCEGAILAIKLCWSDPHAPRVPALVRHQHITRQGVLVGAQFIINSSHACELIENKWARHWYG